MKSFLISIFSLITIGNSFAQEGYIATDTSSSQGQVTDRGVFRNNREVKFAKSKKSPFITYYPKDLKEFGFADNTYVTKMVAEGDSKNPYFLLRQINGSLKLYILKTSKGTRFFGEGNGKMKELQEDSFKDTLTTIVTNHYLDNSVAILKHNKRSLSRFFFLHNKTYKGLFPALRKGIFFGLSNTSLTLKGFENKSISLGNDLSPFLGAFIDFPVGLKPKWLLNAQIFYQENSYSYFSSEPNRNLDFLVNTSNINIPILLKYRSTSTKVRSFITVGPTFTYYLKNSNDLYIATTTGTVVEINKMSLGSISKNQISGTFALGLEYSLKQKNSLGLELRYSNGIGMGGVNNQSVSAIQLITCAYF